MIVYPRMKISLTRPTPQNVLFRMKHSERIQTV